MFKGFDKAKDIQYVYTPVFSSLCGVKLDYNNKAGYLLSGICVCHVFCAGNWKQITCSFVHLYFWPEHTSVLRDLFPLRFLLQVAISLVITKGVKCRLICWSLAGSDVMWPNRKYVARWKNFCWPVWSGGVLGQLVTLTKKESQLQIPDRLWMSGE